MQWIDQFHAALERSLLFSLNRKFAFLYLLLLFPLLLTLLASQAHSQLSAVIQAHGLDARTAADLNASLEHLALWGWLLLAGAALFITVQVIYFNFWIARPVGAITRVFNEVARGEGDLSRDVPEITNDEIAQLAQSCNRFLAKQREVIASVQTMTVGIALEAAKSLKKHQGFGQLNPGTGSTGANRGRCQQWHHPRHQSGFGAHPGYQHYHPAKPEYGARFLCRTTGCDRTHPRHQHPYRYLQ